MQPIDPLKTIQNAWIDVLLRFRAWYLPETLLTREWKFRPLHQAIRSCRASLMDDSEGMLVAYRKNQNDADADIGASAVLPVLLTATAVVDMPPDASQLLGVPYLVDAAYGDMPVRMRVIPTAIRAQVAFYATNPHDARSIAGQLCAYFADDWNRKIEVPFQIGDTEVGKFKFIVFDNNLMPTAIPSEALNISIFTVDITMAGYVPHVLGLGIDGEDDVHMGYNPDGSPNDVYDDNGVPIGGGTDGNGGGGDSDGGAIGDVVIQADQFDGKHIRINADKTTGNVTVKEIKD